MILYLVNGQAGVAGPPETGEPCASFWMQGQVGVPHSAGRGLPNVSRAYFLANLSAAVSGARGASGANDRAKRANQMKQSPSGAAGASGASTGAEQPTKPREPQSRAV